MNGSFLATAAPAALASLFRAMILMAFFASLPIGATTLVCCTGGAVIRVGSGVGAAGGGVRGFGGSGDGDGVGVGGFGASGAGVIRLLSDSLTA